MGMVAHCVIAPAYIRHGRDGYTPVRYTGVLVTLGVPIATDQPAVMAQTLFTCACRDGHNARGHKKILDALECAWQERARRNLAETDPITWHPVQTASASI